MIKINIIQFTEEQKALAGFAGALAHPARIAIIKLLQDWGEAPCGRLVEALPLAQATVSQHIRSLSAVGLLKQRHCGKQVFYSLDCEALRSFCHSFQCTLGTVSAPTGKLRRKSLQTLNKA